MVKVSPIIGDQSKTVNEITPYDVAQQTLKLSQQITTVKNLGIPESHVLDMVAHAYQK